MNMQHITAEVAIWKEGCLNVATAVTWIQSLPADMLRQAPPPQLVIDGYGTCNWIQQVSHACSQ